MLRVILDTNIYGIFIKDKAYGSLIIEKLKKDPTILVHNFKLIRQELRRAPNLLPIYDSIVAKSVIEENRQIKKLANDYLVAMLSFQKIGRLCRTQLQLTRIEQ